MKFTNILVEDQPHLAVITDRGVLDASAFGTMEAAFAGLELPEEFLNMAPVVKSPVFANVIDRPDKLVCVGLNYKSHADKVSLKTADCPILFSKFPNALVPSGARVELPPWETSYDYEAELVIVIGKKAWNVSEAEALDCVFGYTAGNDFSVRDPQMRTSQWLIGKTMPGFGPCGPCIVTADEFDIARGHAIKSYVNGELRQDGNTEDMIFDCATIISYASKYIGLEPGDLIFTGTPSGVQLEQAEKKYLVPGDVVEVEIEGIGTLSNTMV